MEKNTKPVLEFGAGRYSTPFLFWACKDKGIEFKSYETDEAWAKQFEGMTEYVKSYDEVPIEKEWGVVFIDNAPPKRRVKEIKRVKSNSDYIIIHDSDDEFTYDFRNIYPSFKYRSTYTKFKPHTTVLSNRFNIEM